jgi:hypothetical protein
MYFNLEEDSSTNSTTTIPLCPCGMADLVLRSHRKSTRYPSFCAHSGRHFDCQLPDSEEDCT